MESKNTAPGGQDQERIVSEFGNTKEMEREHPFCGAYLLEHISAVINMACRHGGGAVVELKDMAEPTFLVDDGLVQSHGGCGGAVHRMRRRRKAGCMRGYVSEVSERERGTS